MPFYSRIAQSFRRPYGRNQVHPDKNNLQKNDKINATLLKLRNVISKKRIFSTSALTKLGNNNSSLIYCYAYLPEVSKSLTLKKMHDFKSLLMMLFPQQLWYG